jgi:hypothetical protein
VLSSFSNRKNATAKVEPFPTLETLENNQFDPVLLQDKPSNNLLNAILAHALSKQGGPHKLKPHERIVARHA